MLLELGGVRLLTDPLLRSRVAYLRRYGPPPPSSSSRDVDAVLISHLHFDHLDLPSLRRLDPEIRVIGPRGSAEFLKHAGFRGAVELAPGTETNVGPVTIGTVPAVHDGRRRPGGASADAVGFELRGDGRRVYFAGDTDLFPEMAALAGDLDLALLPVWGWGPRLGPGHLDPHSAAEAAALLRPRVAVPIHWGTLFPIGLARRHRDLLRDPPLEFAAQLAALAPEVEARVLAPGESLSL